MPDAYDAEVFLASVVERTVGFVDVGREPRLSRSRPTWQGEAAAKVFSWGHLGDPRAARNRHSARWQPHYDGSASIA